MNLPNKLTLFRIILVPVILIIYVFPYHEFDITIATWNINGVTLNAIHLSTFLIFAVASFTDFLDGYIARKYQLITSFGKFADPIADKLLVNTLLILLAYSNVLALIPVIIMIWRDTIVDAMRMMTAQKGVVVAAGVFGKLKTVFQMCTILFALLQNIPFAFIGFPMVEILLWLSCLVSLYSGYVYFKQMSPYIMESK